MFRKELALVASLLAFGACSLQAAQIDSLWVGGSYGRWGEAGNWSPQIVPDNSAWRTFAVTINSDSIGVDSIEVQLLQNRTVSQLYTYGEVQLDVPDWEDARSCSTIMFTVLEPNNGLTNYGMFKVDQEKHREIEINGDVTNTAGAEIWLSETDFNGNFYNESNGVIDIEYECSIRGNFENAGTMNIWGPVVELWVDNTLHNDGLINLFSADLGANVIINDSNGVIQGWGNIGTEDEGELFQNEGLISASGGSLLIVTENNAISNNGILRSEPGCFLHVKPLFLGPDQADVNNLGKIEVKGGGCVTFYCNLSNQANGQVELLAGNIAATTITQSADANFAGFGGITGDVVIKPNGLIKLTGPTNIVGDVNIPENARLEISDGTTLITGHTTNNGIIRVVNGDVVFQGGYSGSGLVQKD